MSYAGQRSVPRIFGDINQLHKQSLRRWSRRKRNCSTLFHNFFIVRYNGAILTTNLTDPGEKFENIPDVCEVSDLMEIFVGDAAYSSKFPVTSGSKRRYKTTEEGQQIMCEIMERIAKEERDEGRIEGETRINNLYSILIELNRLDDLKRATKDRDYQMQLMIELLPEKA